MSSGKAKEDWDFTPVINLLNSLSTNIEKPSQEASGTLSELPTVNGHVVAGESKDDKDDDDINSGLGNFDKLWKYLGQPLKIPSLNPEPQPDIDLTGNPTFQPIPDSCGNKGVRWRDEVEGADLADNDEAANTSDGLNSSKAQEKKERRRKWKENVPQRKSQANLFPSGSENESELDAHKPTRLLDRRAIIQDILHGPSQREKSFGNSFLKVPSKRQSLSDQEALPIAKPSQLRGTVAALFSIEQTDYAVAAERKAKLIKKLNASFVEERRFLRNICVSPLVNKNVTGMDAGIHVFVDASNIFIGFQDALKISRRIPLIGGIKPQRLSFHNLSLVLERGRPTTKRVLVGSDNFSAVQEAKAVGYEISILERVHKSKELTPRQKKYSSFGAAGQSSGSETTAVTNVREKWVEQAVDEILHLKILESVVDAKVPSTIVLATGDAAEAEYSGGFMKMVERALGKGWKVELVSFKHNTSGAYRKKNFRTKWGTMFKHVELDAFVEELLGV